MFISNSLSVPHYSHFAPLQTLHYYPFRPIWYPRLALEKSLLEGRYRLKPHPHDGMDKVLAAYNVSENAIKIIRESVEVVEFSCDDKGKVTFSKLPGVDVAR